MRCSIWIGPTLSILEPAMAQGGCLATVTVTSLMPDPGTPASAPAPASDAASSASISRQVLTLTQVNTVIMTSNGIKVEKTQAVTNMLLVEDGHTIQATTSGLINPRQATSCPPAVTVTLTSQQTATSTSGTITSSRVSTQTDTGNASASTTTSDSMSTTPSSTSSSAQSTQSSEGSPTIPSAPAEASISLTTSKTQPLATSGDSTTSHTMPYSTSSSSYSSSSGSQSSTTISSVIDTLHSKPSRSSAANRPMSQSSTTKISFSSSGQTSHIHNSSSQATIPSPSSSTKPSSTSSSSTSMSSSTSISDSGVEKSPSPTKSPSSSADSGTSPGSSIGHLPPTMSPSPSDTPRLPPSSTTGPSSSTLHSVTLVSEIDPNLWKSPSPTVTCNVPCSLSLPCLTLDKPTTVSPPPYTTSLCRQHCDVVNFRSMTTISIPPITATRVCFYPMQAEAADVFTAAPNWFGGDGGLINISAPATLSTCPPHWPTADSDGMCGPDNHYLCPKKKCCGKDNKCGTSLDYCGDGCQLNWGYCWKNSTTCKMPRFDKDNGKNYYVPIFPIWFDAPDPPGPPPPLTIRTGKITFPPPPDQCAILGCKGDCGWISCEGLAGWFIKMIRIPKLECNIVTKTVCRLLKLPCCKKKGGGGGDIDCDFCDPPDGSMLNGDGKVCDPNMENCDDLPEEEDDDECTRTSSATDRTIYCTMATAPAGRSSQTCTSTATKVRSGCTIKPGSTKTTKSTGCKTTTVNVVSELCQVITGASTTRTHCPSTITKQASGCEATTLSVFTTSCDEMTATHISELCSVATAANSTSTYCRSTQSRKVSGCDVTGSATSVFTTDCFSRTRVTNRTVSCFALGSTVVAGSTIIPSTTCTATATTVWSGCELTGSTTSVISTSFPACAASAQITLEPMPTFASNLTESSATACGPPTSSSFPECTKIVVGQYVVTEAIGEISGSGITARDAGALSTATLSCYCGPTAGADIWPVTVCDGKSTWCPNEATTAREQTGTPAPPTLPATPT